MAGATRAPRRDSQIILPLHAEEISVGRRTITGSAQISISTRCRQVVIGEPVARELVEIERVPVNRFLEHAPAVREEGDTIIIPVLEEVLIVERKLMLKEEIRVRRVREVGMHKERVDVRKQSAVITRSGSRLRRLEKSPAVRHETTKTKGKVWKEK